MAALGKESWQNLVEEYMPQRLDAGLWLAPQGYIAAGAKPRLAYFGEDQAVTGADAQAAKRDLTLCGSLIVGLKPVMAPVWRCIGGDDACVARADAQVWQGCLFRNG